MEQLGWMAPGFSIGMNDPSKPGFNPAVFTIDQTKVPGLRNLAARPPYFHNGSAPDLAIVVDYHDRRFSIGLSAQEKSDLVAFPRVKMSVPLRVGAAPLREAMPLYS